MFKNATHDPLAVPQPVERVSQGPTNRRTAGYVKVAYGPSDYAGNGPASDWVDYDEYKTPEEIAAQGPPPGARGRSYAEEHGIPPRGGLTPADGAYHVFMHGRVATVIDRQAREFLAGHEAEGTDHRPELLYRARRYAATQTSTWSPEASQRAVEAFCARVAELIPNRPKVAAAQPVTHVADFDDQLLF